MKRHVQLAGQIPNLPNTTFSRLRLYHHDGSGEAAFEFSPLNEWSSLNDRFEPWIDGLVARGLLPDWIDQRLVIGSVPGSANFLLVPTAGPKRGCLFKFDHDGFQFRELAPSIEAFVRFSLDPGPDLL